MATQIYRWLPISKKWVSEDTENKEDYIQMLKETGCMGNDINVRYFCKLVDGDKVNYTEVTQHTNVNENTGQSDYFMPINSRLEFSQPHKRQLPLEIIKADNIEFDETEEQYFKRQKEKEYFHIFIVNDNCWYKVKIADFGWFVKNGFLTENDIIRTSTIDKFGDIIRQENVSQYAYLRFTEDCDWIKYYPGIAMPLIDDISIGYANDPKVKQYEDVYIEQMTGDNVKYLELERID